MLKTGTCCCYHCGSVFNAAKISFYDADTGQRWAEQNGVYVPNTGDPGKVKATLLKEHGVPDQLDLENNGRKKTLHTRVCPSCGEELAEGMGHYPIYNFLMCGLPGSGKTAFCQYLTSQVGRQVLKKLGLTISAPGKINAAKLTATQVGQTKQYRICVSDGKQTSYVIFWDTAGELYTLRRAQDARVEDKFCQLKRTLSNLGAAVDGCIVMLDTRNLTPHHTSAAPEDAETATDDFVQWLRLRFGKSFPLLFVFNKSDLLQRTLNDHSDCITTQSLLFKNAMLSKRALSVHIALSQRFMRSGCYANTAPGDPSFTVQLGQPLEGDILSFDAAKNASLPIIWLLHHFKICSSALPD